MKRGIIILLGAAIFRFVNLSVTSNESEHGSDDEIGIPGTSLTSRNVGIFSFPSIFSFDSTVVNPSIKVGNRVGLQNPQGILCYMNAVFSCMFNIHRLREAVYSYESELASHALIAELFARLQTSKTPVSTDLTLIHSLKEDINWTFRGHQCNLEFGEKIFGFLPQSVKDLYMIKVRHDAFMRSNGEFISSRTVDESHYVIPIAFPSISAAILSDFPDNHPENTFFVYQSEYEDFRHLIPPFEGYKFEVPVFRKSVFINRPEILIFGLRRQKFTETGVNPFDQTKMELDLEITLPGVEQDSGPIVYYLHAFCYHRPGHHLAYVRDFSSNPEGDWFHYDDSRVTAVRTVGDYKTLHEKANTAATMAFYVRADSIMTVENKREIAIPETVMIIAKLMSTLQKDPVVEPVFPLAEIVRPMPYSSVDYYKDFENSFTSLYSDTHESSEKKESERSKTLPPLVRGLFADAFPLDDNGICFEAPVEEA